jgi:hypothetical protein
MAGYGPTFGNGYDFYPGTDASGTGGYCNTGGTYHCRGNLPNHSSDCRFDFCGNDGAPAQISNGAEDHWTIVDMEASALTRSRPGLLG